MSELLPCPFCGSAEIRHQHHIGGMADTPGYYYCQNCQARGPSYYFAHGDCDKLAWNSRRTDGDERFREKIKAFVELADKIKSQVECSTRTMLSAWLDKK